MKTELLAYTAGIIDGEGFIGIRKGKPRIGRINFSYDLVVAVAMTNRDLIEWLCERFEGATCVSVLRSCKHKHVYRWTVWNNKAERFLRSIQPFLRVKVRQAEIGIKLCESIAEGKHREHKKGVPTDVLNFREGLYTQIRCLNKRGVG